MRGLYAAVAGRCRSTATPSTLPAHACSGATTRRPALALRRRDAGARAPAGGWLSTPADCAMTIDPLAQRPPGHLGRRRRLGPGRRGALLVDGATARLGRRRRRPARRRCARRRRARPRRRAASRPAWSTATPTWSTAATARASSSCACKARATRRSRAPAAASARPWRPPAPPATTRCSTQRRGARPRADGRRRDDARDQVGLRPDAEHEARCLRVARRLGRELPLTVRTTCLAAHALPPEFDGRADDYIDAVCAWLPALHAEGLVDAVDAFCDTHRLHAGADAARLRGGARARPAGQAARRTAQRPGRRRAGRASSARSSCDHLEHLATAGVAAMARRRHAWPCCCPAPTTSCARRSCRRSPALRDAGVPIAHRHRPQPGLVAGAVAAADAQHGLHAVPPDARRGAARRHGARARARSAWPTAAALAAGQRADFVVWDAGAPARAGLLVRPQPLPRASSAAARSTPMTDAMTDDRADLHPAPRQHAAAGQRAARRHRHPGRPARALRAARARRRGHRLAPRPPLRLRARARRQPDRAALLALRDRPEPAAREHADVSRRQQHRAVPDALLHRRAALPRRPGARRGRDRAPRRAPTGGPTTTRWPRELARLQRAAWPRGAVRRPQHQARAALAVRGHAARPEPRHRRRRSCAPALRDALAGGAGGAERATATSSTAASRAATSRATTAARPTACTRCSSRCAGAPTWTRRRRYALDPTRAAARCSRCCARWCRRCSTGDRADAGCTPAHGTAALLWAPRAWLAGALARRRAAARRRRRPLGRGRSPASPTPPAGASVLAGPVLPGLVDAHSHAFQRAFAGLAERARAARATTSGRWRDRMYGVALRITPEQLRAVAAQLVRRAAARRLHAGLRVPLPAPRARRPALRRPADAGAGRWPTRPPKPASA